MSFQRLASERFVVHGTHGAECRQRKVCRHRLSRSDASVDAIDRRIGQGNLWRAALQRRCPHSAAIELQHCAVFAKQFKSELMTCRRNVTVMLFEWYRALPPFSLNIKSAPPQ